MGATGEERVLRLLRRAGLGPRRVPRSQSPASRAEYADLICGPFLIEEKETAQRTIPLAEWFEKLRREAGRMAKLPLIWVSHPDIGDVVILDADAMIKLLKG